MFRPSTKMVIALGQVMLLVGILLFATTLGYMPDQVQSAVKVRGSLCELVALNTSVLASRGEFRDIRAILAWVVDRRAQVLSAAMRRRGGRLMAATHNHEALWSDKGHHQVETHIEVPVFVSGNDEPWGTVELTFRPISDSGFMGAVRHPRTKMIAFISICAFVAFYFYLGVKLKSMDPSKAIPSRVRQALNVLAGGLIVTDDRGDIVLANEAIASCLGVKAEQLMGKSVDSLPWRFAEESECPEFPWQESLRTQIPRIGVTLKLEGKSGTRTFIVNNCPVIGHDGNLRGLFIGLEDVTELGQKEIELRESRAEAVQASIAKSEFLARMSHEIRTPMNAILGFTDVLRRGFDHDVKERQEYLNTIHSSGAHLLALINDILDLSKVESGQMELEQTECSPHRLTLEVLQVLQVRADDRSISLAYEPQDDVPATIISDPVRLKQIVTNLVGNAIKFTEEGGVRVVTSIAGTEQQPLLQIDVIDTGIGMKPEALEKIFKPFSQADSSVTRRFGGTGLGLAICKRIAGAMGGSIGVQSELGVGTVFTARLATGSLDGVRLISGEEAKQTTKTQVQETLEVSLPPCRILIVDDGASNRKLLALLLSRAGAELQMAENGEEAVERVNFVDFDLVLMDMQMPVMDGYTAATTLRQQGHTFPIVALTAHAMKGDEEKCMQAGCTHFLPKPVDANRLMELMALILGGDLRETEPNTYTTAIAAPSIEPTGQTSSTVRVEDVTEASLKFAGAPIISELPMDDLEFRDIVAEFVDRLKVQLDAMETAAEAGDYQELARLGHWLKGSGGTAGFPALTQPAIELERQAKAAERDRVFVSIECLRDLTDRIYIPVSTPMEPAN